MCYRAEFGRYALNNVSINTGEPAQIGERWNSAHLCWEAWLTPRYMYLPDMCYHVIQIW